MAVAAPKRRSSTAPAPAPSRTTAPKRKKAAPARRAAATAPARTAPARAPQRTRPRPQRARPKPKRSTGGQLIPLAVGRTAATVRHLPDSGLIVRMTRGRAWIAVLGVLLAGIVALNVVTLSFAASSGKIDAQITPLEKENSMLESRVGERFGTERIRFEAAQQGLVMPNVEAPKVIESSPQDAVVAAQRLAGAG